VINNNEEAQASKSLQRIITMMRLDPHMLIIIIIMRRLEPP
jgi:hypothetical protein